MEKKKGKSKFIGLEEKISNTSDIDKDGFELTSYHFSSGKFIEYRQPILSILIEFCEASRPNNPKSTYDF